MPPFAQSRHLLRVGKGKKSDIDHWKYGAYLQVKTGKTIEQLRLQAAADRYGLAASFLREARRLNGKSARMYRFAVSRCYYSMYHAMRAVVYVVYGGDDFEEHRALPANAPPDLNNQAVWSNALKNARERRNAADYDPYPKSDAAWQTDASSLQTQARDFLREVKFYLRGKGCTIV
jgi:uncharacterized protein (UPF0332 family)